MRTRSVLIAFSLLASTLCAQQNVKWTDGSTASTGGGNAFPWGSEGVRYQQIVQQSVLGKVPGHIKDIYVAGAATQEVVYGDIEIRMGITQQTSLAANWNTNNPNPTTVYRGPLRVSFVANTWTGIGLPTKYLWLPKATTDNLCIEVIVWKVTDKGGTTGTNFMFPRVSTSQGRAFRYQWTTNQTQGPLTGTTTASRLGLIFNDGNFVPLGKGCPGSNGTPTIGSKPGTWPVALKPFAVQLSSGPQTAPVFLFIGSTDTKWLTLQLPFDLAPLGAKGCMVWHDQLVVVASATNATGDASFQITAPNIPDLYVMASWWCLDKGANKLGFTTSGYGKLIY